VISADYGLGTYVFGISGSNIVGTYYATNFFEYGFFYDGNTFTTLNVPTGANGTVAYGVSGGRVVGYYTRSDFSTHGFCTKTVNTPQSIIQPPMSLMRSEFPTITWWVITPKAARTTVFCSTEPTIRPWKSPAGYRINFRASPAIAWSVIGLLVV